MSNTVDQRIVSMQFDNKQFESGVQTSVSSLDKLKKSLNLSESAKSLSELDKVGKRFSLSGMADSVNSVAERFSAMGIVGMTVLQNITNQGVEAGKRLVAAFTIDPVKTGFSEYELKMNAIQTMMVGSGESLETVNKYLNELNAYSDKTVYSFSDMTQNIGKFTNAGVGLKDSVKAIQGVANVAALAGANNNEAARSMYNFAQAMSAGHVKLIDWKSIEMANMATKGFKDQLIQTGLAMGTITKTGDGMYKTLNGTVFNSIKGFNESLSDQWLTSNVLVSTLGKYTDETTDLGKQAIEAAQSVKTLSQLMSTLKEAAQSGWAQTWEILVGNFDEAKSLYTEINNVLSAMIGSSAEARNSMLQGWKDLGGRKVLIDGIRNVLLGLAAVMKPIGEAFKEIFPRKTSQQLYDMTVKFKELTDKFKIGEETATNLKRTFKGVFAAFDIIGMAVSAVVGGIGKLVGLLLPAGEGITTLSGSLGDFMVNIRDTLKSTGAFNKLIDWMLVLIKPLINFLKAAGTQIKEWAKTVQWSTLPVKDFMDTVQKIFDSFDGFGERSKKASKKMKQAFSPVSSIGDKIRASFNAAVEAVKVLSPEVSAAVEDVKTNLNKFGTAVVAAFKSFDWGAVKNLFIGGLIGILVGSISKLLWNFGDLLKGFSRIENGVAGVLKGVQGSLEAWQKSIKADAIMKIAKSLILLAIAVWILSTIDVKQLAIAMGALTVMFAELFGSIAVFDKVTKGAKFDSIGKITAAMIGMAFAVLILAYAVKKLSKMKWEELAKGLIAVSALIGMLTLYAKVMAKSEGDMIKAGIGLLAFAFAISKLSKVLIKLSKLDLLEMGKGLLILGLLMGELALFMRVSKMEKIGADTGLGFLLIAIAIEVLADAIKRLASLKLGQLFKGMIALGLLLTMLAGFIFIIGDPKDMVGVAAGLTIMAIAMLLFVSVIKALGSMPLAELAIGLGALTIALFVLAAAMTIMQGTSSGAAALVIMTGALILLYGVVWAFGTMDLQTLAVGLTAVAVVMGVLGLTALAMATSVPVLIGLAAAIGLFVLACVAAGVGIVAFTMGLQYFAQNGMAGVEALKMAVSEILGLIPLLLQKIGEGIIAFAQVLIDGAPVIAEAIKSIALAIIDTIVTVIPAIVTALATLVLSILEEWARSVPQMVDAGMRLILGILRGIADHIQDVVEAGADIVIGFLDGVSTKLPDIIDSAFKVFIAFINGMADAIRNNHKTLLDAAVNLIDAVVGSIAEALGLGDVYKKGKEILTTIVDGIKEGAKKAWDTLVDIGEDIINGLVKGVKNLAGNLVDSAMNVVGDALDAVKDFFGIASPSKVMMGIGEFLDLGLIKGLDGMSADVSKSSASVGKSAVSSMEAAISKVADIVDSDADFNPVITPVMDMTDVENGLSNLDRQLSDKKVISVSASRDKAQSATSVPSDPAKDTTTAEKAGSAGSTYVFNQNNYSPKALSRIDIYRQTKNQFSALKGLVEAT